MDPFSLRSILLCIYPFDVVAEISVTLFEMLVQNVVIQSFLYKVSLNPLVSNLLSFENFILEFSASQNEQS